MTSCGEKDELKLGDFFNSSLILNSSSACTGTPVLYIRQFSASGFASIAIAIGSTRIGGGSVCLTNHL